MNVTFGAAFAAGLLSFLSPCVLPLIPSYIGFITGMTAEELDVHKGTALKHATWFVAGFSIIFLVLGATASALGSFLLQYQLWIGRVGGVLVLAFGLWLVHLTDASFDQTWLQAALALFVAVGLVGGLGGRRPRHARELAQSGGSLDEVLRLLDEPWSRVANYASAALVLAILALMIWQ